MVFSDSQLFRSGGWLLLIGPGLVTGELFADLDPLELSGRGILGFVPRFSDKFLCSEAAAFSLFVIRVEVRV